MLLGIYIVDMNRQCPPDQALSLVYPITVLFMILYLHDLQYMTTCIKGKGDIMLVVKSYFFPEASAAVTERSEHSMMVKHSGEEDEVKEDEVKPSGEQKEEHSQTTQDNDAISESTLGEHPDILEGDDGKDAEDDESSEATLVTLTPTNIVFRSCRCDSHSHSIVFRSCPCDSHSISISSVDGLPYGGLRMHSRNGHAYTAARGALSVSLCHDAYHRDCTRRIWVGSNVDVEVVAAGTRTRDAYLAPQPSNFVAGSHLHRMLGFHPPAR
ncbi:hypothetical protein Vadar_034141 [Vaccinium darrowii]|uniref:Uncharacterized protein n=1 Tax=Vaccinium darrowii TaxID=229202 RepID=A0ACB7YAY9_9ERIC|nr:hypothetical protein Vadar_034141 [Vaccinium darrowii]